MSSTGAGRGYVMGRDERERRRLALQATILNPLTEELFRRAGIREGMRVLDFGSGTGDVALLAARMVGSTGSVTAIDVDDAALAVAEGRVREAGISNITFQHRAIEDFAADRPFDAATCRHVLIHTRSPVEALRAVHGHLREGGVAAAQEYDFSITHFAYPEWPLREQMMRVFREFFGRLGQGNIGTRLYHLLLEAGFRSPECRVEYLIAGGAGNPIYEWAAESLRSIYPHAQQMGLLEGADIDFDTLAEKLEEDSVRLRACFPGPPMIGAFARKL